MKNSLKKISAAALAVIMIIMSFAGCYSENNLWAAKKGDVTLPIGGYIYYLSAAYSEVRGEVNEDTEVLKAKIDGEKAESVIKDKALDEVKAFFFLHEKANELGLSLSDADKSEAEYNTEYMWMYYGEAMEEMGCSQESFHEAYTIYNTLFTKIFTALYEKGGEKEVSEDEIRTYYEDTYTTYEEFSASLTYLDENEESVEHEDEDKAAIIKNLEEYKKDVDSGEKTMTESAFEYQNINMLESDTYNDSQFKTDEAAGDVQEAVLELKVGETAIVETATTAYLVRKTSATEKVNKIIDEAYVVPEEETADDTDENTDETDVESSDVESDVADEDETSDVNDTAESDVNEESSEVDDADDADEDTPSEPELSSEMKNLLYEMREDDFRDYIKEESAKITDIEYNKSSMNMIKLSSLVTEENKMGSVEVPDESSEAESSDEESSATDASDVSDADDVSSKEEDEDKAESSEDESDAE